MTQQELSTALHSRGASFIMMALALTLAGLAYAKGDMVDYDADKGLLLPSPNQWLDDAALSLAASLALNALTVTLMSFINSTFNPFRSMTGLFAGLFFMFQAATPRLMVSLYGGTLTAAVMMTVTVILFSVYGTTDNTRRVFLMGLLLSATATCQYAAAFYLPLVLLGCAEMRVFNLRSLLACIVGVITPFWIIFGLGLRPLDALRWPDFVSYFSALPESRVLSSAITTGITVALGLLATVFNLFKVLSYNNRARAFNGFLCLTFLATALLMLFDFIDIICYVPLLNCCAAFQIAHFFALHKSRRSYIAILTIIAGYVALSLWNIAN
jgi:hypothetical protein